MPYGETHKHEATDAIFTWAVKSERPRAGGLSAKYEILLYSDGCVSCDCPGWMFHRRQDSAGGKTIRGCKHVDAIEEEASDLIRRHRRGEVLPTFEEESGIQLRSQVRPTKTATPTAPPEKFGRVLDI